MKANIDPAVRAKLSRQQIQDWLTEKAVRLMPKDAKRRAAARVIRIIDSKLEIGARTGAAPGHLEPTVKKNSTRRYSNRDRPNLPTGCPALPRAGDASGCHGVEWEYPQLCVRSLSGWQATLGRARTYPHEILSCLGHLRKRSDRSGGPECSSEMECRFRWHQTLYGCGPGYSLHLGVPSTAALPHILRDPAPACSRGFQRASHLRTSIFDLSRADRLETCWEN